MNLKRSDGSRKMGYYRNLKLEEAFWKKMEEGVTRLRCAGGYHQGNSDTYLAPCYIHTDCWLIFCTQCHEYYDENFRTTPYEIVLLKSMLRSIL
jgi:hypothetical protein